MQTMHSLSVVMHQTCLVQWTWDILSIQDYPGASNEWDPHSSHPSYKNSLRWRRIPEEMTILESNDCLMSSRHHSPENEPRSRRNEGEMEEKSPDYVPSARCWQSNLLNISSVFGAIQHMIIPSWSLEPGLRDGLVPTKVDSVPMEIFSSQSRHSFR